MRGNLLRAIATVGGLTLVSRVAGFVGLVLRHAQDEDCFPHLILSLSKHEGRLVES